MSQFTATRPFPVTAPVLTSNIPETPPPAYDIGTTYATDDTASVFSGTDLTTASVYRSLEDDNLGNDPTSSPDQWLFLGTLYKAWDALFSYTAAGVVVQHNHALWESSDASSGKEPGSKAGADKWFRLSEDNRFKMFGEATAIRSEWAEEIAVSIASQGIVNNVGLLSVKAAAARVKVTDTGTVIYDETQSLIDNSMVDDWFEYLFEPIRYRTDYVFDDLPTGIDAQIEVSITAADTVAVGKLVVGQKYVLGETLYPASLGATNYSQFNQDEFGSPPDIIKRNSTKRQRYLVSIEEPDIDFVYSFMSQFEAEPLFVVAASEYSAMISYGNLRDWTLDAENVSKATLSVDMRAY